MNNQLTEHLIKVGLLQFGNFGGIPFRFSFHLLPSYPDLLAEICDTLYQNLESRSIERLVCTTDALPVALGISQRSMIPLVYSRGSNDAPVFDLVGAYDVGHPTVMLTSIVESTESVNRFIKRAESVGLRIQTVQALVDLRNPTGDSSETSVSTLFDFQAVLAYLVEANHLTTHQQAATKKWLEER